MRFSSVTQRVAGLGSDKWKLSLAARDRMDRGLEVINLTIGEPDVGTPPELAEVARDAIARGRTGYSNGRAEMGLLRALSARYAQRLGRPLATDRFMAAPGTQTALYLAFQTLCDPGDEVILGDPLYATYEALIRAPGAQPVTVALDPARGFRLDARDVERAITPRTRVIFLNSPHNPTGAILTTQDLNDLCELAQKHDLWIVSDEVYGDLTHDGVPAPSALMDPRFEDRVVVAASISKSHAAPGFRSGWICASAEFCRRALPVSETMLFGQQPFIADMTAAALSSPPEMARAMAARMARRAGIVVDSLDGVAGMRVHRPEAGMFALLDIRALSHDSEAFALDLLERTGVAVMPGASFGAALEGWLRLALRADDEDMRRACQRIRAYAESM